MDVSSPLLIRGIVAIAAGLIAMLWPGVTLVFLIMLFAIYALIDGVTNLAIGFRRAEERGRSWPMILRGFIGIAAGVIAFGWPGITTLALVFGIAAWAIVTGAFEVAAAIRYRRELQREWLLVLSGILSIGFGVLLAIFPAAGAVGLAWALGVFLAASGILLVAVALQLRARRIVTS